MRALTTLLLGLLSLAWPLTAQGHLDGSALTPVPGANVQIGTDTDILAVTVDRRSANGYLFAVLHRSGQLFRILRSTDGGATWTSAALVDVGATIGWMDSVVVGGYLYVAYAVGDEARLRRASSETGVMDATFGDRLIVSEAPESVCGVKLVGNQADGDDTIWYLLLTCDYRIRAFEDSAADGTTFTDRTPTAITNAWAGLDATWNVGYPAHSTEEVSLLLSYVDSSGNVVVYRRDETGTPTWIGSIVVSTDSLAEEARLSAFHDFVALGFEESDGSGWQNPAYRTSADGGFSWDVHPPLATATAGSVAYYNPLLDVTSGSGLAVALLQWTSGANHIWFREKCNYGSSDWSSAIELGDQYPGIEDGRIINDFEWLGSGWALAYVSVTGKAWFTWSPSIRYCGFECGSLDEWSAAIGGP